MTVGRCPQALQGTTDPVVEHESRSAEERPGRYEFDDVVVDADNYRVLKAGQPRALAPRPFDLLLDLLRNPGRVVGKQELFDRV